MKLYGYNIKGVATLFPHSKDKSRAQYALQIKKGVVYVVYSMGGYSELGPRAHYASHFKAKSWIPFKRPPFTPGKIDV
jgi:hypothetical protein